MATCSRCSSREAEEPYRTCSRCREHNVRRQQEIREAAKAHMATLAAAPAVPAPAPAPAPEPASPPVPQRAPESVPERGAASGLVAILADLHVPEHDEGCLRAFEAWARDAKPREIIVAGDFLEMESACQHPGARPSRHEDEMAAGLRVAHRLLALSPRVTIRAGNHDVRAARVIPASLGAIYDPLDALRLAGAEIDRRTHTPTRRGSLLVLHGDEFLRSKFPPMHHARKAIEVYAEPGATICYGHVHKRQHHVRPMEAGNCDAISLPCMRSLEPAWLGPEVSGWTQGWGAAQLEPGRRATVEVIEYVGGCAWWGGRRYA
jgi:predicted phosphodiesterase